MNHTSLRLLSAAIVFLGTSSGVRAAQSEALQILAASGVKGGLVVHLGCGDGKLTAALRANESYLVQGLDADAGKVAAAREWIQSLGLYGKVTAEPWTGGRLPYTDNLVNLLVCEQPGQVSQEEIFRVLSPRGVAYVKQAGDWHKTVKPWPEEIDQWTHHLHDAGGNAVARDRVVGPPRHVQWTAGPLWSRSHGWSPSASAMVSAAGRVFWICDESLRGIDGTVPDQWFLSARDAFSGVLLWKRPVPHWGSQELSGTPGDGKGSTNGRFSMPPHLAKRLVAVDDTVYVTLGAAAPVTALDAATGQERRTYVGTAGADEILCTGTRLIVALNPAQRPQLPAADETHPPAPVPGKRICAVDAATGKVLWNKGPFTAIRATRTQDPFGRLELAAGDGRAFLLTDQAVEALSMDSGDTAWRIARPALPAQADRRLGFAGMYDFLLSVLVYQDGVVLLAQPEPNAPHTTHSMPGTLYAFDARDGHTLWKQPFGTWGHCTQPDVYVIDGLVWTYVDAKGKIAISDKGWASARDRSVGDYRIVGLDLRTGQLRRELPTKDIFDVGHHHRCFRNMITERFLMASRRGVEFVDLATGENYQNHWVRSGCLLGDVPCNGLLYVAPHACACYINAKLTGFNALAPAREGSASGDQGRGGRSEGSIERGLGTPDGDARLTRGPAYDQIQNLKSEISNSHSPLPTSHSPLSNPHDHAAHGARIPNPSASDWPTYRHDPQRSGATESPVPAKLKISWKASLGARPSGLTVAGGRVFVAGVDAHTVYALGAGDGRRLWSYTAEARVDSPPTVYQGLAAFGSADGRVYALRASDGALAWRFQAAPQESRVMVFDQLESPWPVPGSVLVVPQAESDRLSATGSASAGLHETLAEPVAREGKCWFAAGRSSYLDGGIQLFTLDFATGKVAHEQTIYSADPKTGKMPLETEGMRMAGLLNDIPAAVGPNVFIRQMSMTSTDAPEKGHLYSTAGYLDPSWFNRTAWGIGEAKTSGLMVLGKDFAYGVEVYGPNFRETAFHAGGGNAVFTPGASAYRLVCFSLKEPSAKLSPKRPRPAKAALPPPVWRQPIGIRVTAMVRAGEVIFVAGSPDIVDPQDPHGAWEGRQGGMLAALSAADGKTLAKIKLPSPPVWDGMAAASGKLYVGLEEGTVACLSAAGE